MASILKVNDLQDLSGGSPTLGGTAKELLGIGGDGYSWVGETDNRDFETTYTNDTGKPIEVLATVIMDNTSTNRFGGVFKVDDVNVLNIEMPSDGSDYHYLYARCLVPDGSTYYFSKSDSNQGLKEWFELK